MSSYRFSKKPDAPTALQTPYTTSLAAHGFTEGAAIYPGKSCE